MAKSPPRPYPRKSLQDSLRIPQAIKDKNGGNPWPPDQIAEAIGVGSKTGNYFYLTAASRDYGLTEGTRDSAEISLTSLGRRIVYPTSNAEETQAKLNAFFNVDLFRRVVDHFGGDNLPEQKFLTNTLQTKFGLAPEVQEEFVDLFHKNCKYLGIGTEFKVGEGGAGQRTPARLEPTDATDEGTVTVAVPDPGEGQEKVCFVIMPFVERDDSHNTGFFKEVLASIISPAATEVGFTVRTADRQGSDVIQSTIVNDLLEADLVLADLTEHNPNVLFELGLRMHADLPICLIKAKGTGPIFDIDYMMRVVEYNPNLWPSTVTDDLPTVTAHIAGAWDNRESTDTYMSILRRNPLPPSG